MERILWYHLKYLLLSNYTKKFEIGKSTILFGQPLKKAEDSTIIEVNPQTLKQAAMRADPGDVLLLSLGYYGAFSMLVEEESDKPIVLRADNTHPAIGSTFKSVELENRKNVITDGLTVWGLVQLKGAENVAVRYFKVESQYGIISKQPY